MFSGTHSDEAGSQGSLGQLLTLSVVNWMVLSIHKASVSRREGSADFGCPAATQDHQDLQRTSSIHQLHWESFKCVNSEFEIT